MDPDGYGGAYENAAVTDRLADAKLTGLTY